MQFTCDAIAFKRALSQIVPVVPNRTTVPIISNVLIDAADRVSLTATDLAQAVTVNFEADVHTAGKCTVPAKKLYDIIRTAGGVDVTISTLDGDRVSIDAGSASFRLMGLPADDFPAFYGVDSLTMEMQGDMLISAFKLVLNAVSRDDTRYVLNGVYMHSDGGSLACVGTDGKRLAVAECPSVDNWPSGIIVPASAASYLVKTVDDGDNVRLGVADGVMSFQYGDNIYSTRLIEGDYPNYSAIVKSTQANDSLCVVDTQMLTDAVKRMALVAGMRPCVEVSASPGALVVNAVSDTDDTGSEAIDAESVTGDFVVRLNARYLLDALRCIDTENVLLTVKDADSPVAVKPSPEGDNTMPFVSVIMPMRRER